jgi:predicted phosphodiesterase
MHVSLRVRTAILFFILTLTVSASPPFKPAAKEAVTFAIIGDSGTGEAAQFEVARQMKATREKTPFDFVLMLGDNIYPNGEAARFKPCFEEPYKDLLKDGVKFYAALGNHDLERGTDAALHYDHFHMDGHRYYHFTKGDNLIEFFALDSSVMTSEQLAWAEDKLKASKAKWKVAFFHHPLYSSARKHGSDERLRQMLEPLFMRYKVDVAFAGHDHVYERIKPQNGIYYFTEGASGKLRAGNIDRRSAIFEAGNDAIHSFLLVQVEPSQMKVEAIGADGKILDSTVIGKAK